MFDKNNFANIIKNIKELYNSQEEFSEKSEIGRTYLSQYMNMKLNEPPQPKILQKLADASKGLVSYDELMTICGYYEETIESKVYNIYKNLKDFQKYMNNGKVTSDDDVEIEGFLENFQEYTYKLHENLTFKSTVRIYLHDFFNFSTAIEDYKYISGFLLIYNSFIKLLQTENYITIKKYEFINCFDIEEIYNNLIGLEHLELFSLFCDNISINRDNCDTFDNTIDSDVFEKLVNYIDSFSRCLTLAHLSDFDSNSLIELFKIKALQKNSSHQTNYKDTAVEKENIVEFVNNSSFFNCPVYGRISAGVPNWAEECLESYLPLDPNLMNINNPEECFFLRVNGESMNKLVRNGAYALIRKQDVVENGDIAVVLVDNYDATLKKFTKHGDVVVLEPMSNDPNFQTQIYDKNTDIKILGKYLGKFELN